MERSEGAIETAQVAEASYWPVVLAGALTIVLAGLVVHLAVALVGIAVSLVALIAWSLERFQGPSLEADSPHEMPRPGVAAQAAAYSAGFARRGEPGMLAQRWGLVLFIVSEAVFFANLIAAYQYLRLMDPAGHTPQAISAMSSVGHAPVSLHLDLAFPSVNTVILLASSLPAIYAERSIRKGNRRGLEIGLVLAALMGAVFLAGQVYEYTKVGFTLQTSALAAAFFVLTGFHGAHVFVGIALLLGIFVSSLRGRITSRRSFPVEVVTTYWHFVDAVWIFLFTNLYLIR